MGICYANIAAQMYDAYRVYKGDNLSEHLSDPSVLAATYASIYKYRSYDDLEDGYFGDALTLALENGTCDKKSVIWSHDQIVDQYRIYKAFKNGSLYQDAAAALSCHRTVDHKNIENLKGIISAALEAPSPGHFIAKVMSEACKNNIKILPAGSSPIKEYNKIAGKSPLEREEIFAKMIEENSKLPIAFNINYSIIGATGKSIEHFMLMTGQRKKNGRCQILLRDTYGPDACTTRKYSKAVECENGAVWIDRKMALSKTNWLNSLHD